MSSVHNPYLDLARSLDALPNGFPAAPDGSELKLLVHLFTQEEAFLAAQLNSELELPQNIYTRLYATHDLEFNEFKKLLKQMARKGLIAAGRIDAGLGYRLMPFVVGIYEAQVGRIDKELAQLFENYYQQAFAKVLSDSPAYHRVIPIGESIRIGMEIRPYENALEIVSMAQSWGVLDCICRTQKALLGDPCHHPIDVCMIFSQRPEAFDHHPNIRAVDRSQAQQTLRRAADAGLVHSVTNTKEGIHYICNCCTCSCGILRGVSEFGIANAVASSSFINQVDETLCIACGDCITYCQFDAIEMHEIAKIIQTRCTGCGVCVAACTENALGLVRRPENEITIIPVDHSEWENQRMKARNRTAF